MSWQEREQFWIEHYKTLGHDLTNGTAGGDGIHNPTEQTRRNMSLAQSGKIISAEARAKQSKALKGRKKTEAHRKAAALAKVGHRHTQASKDKMSARKKGKLPAVTKTYLVTWPDGRIEKVFNMAAFCREHDLSSPKMAQLNTGKLSHYRGFKVQEIRF